jgi:hypothetical protein
MKHLGKILPVAATLILGLSTPLAMADDTEKHAGNHDNVKNSQTSDKPDAYAVDDKKEKGLTSAKKPVRKLDHKVKTKGDKPVDTPLTNEQPDAETATGSATGN